MLVAWDVLQTGFSQIVIAGSGAHPATKALLAEVRSRFLPRAVILLADGGQDQAFLAENSEAIRQMRPLNGVPAVYVCKNFTCTAPVTSVEALRKAL